MTDRPKLLSLRTRLVEAQRALIQQAAEAGVTPSAAALQRIADLDSAILAVEAMIGDDRPT